MPKNDLCFLVQLVYSLYLIKCFMKLFNIDFSLLDISVVFINIFIYNPFVNKFNIKFKQFTWFMTMVAVVYI